MSVTALKMMAAAYAADTEQKQQSRQEKAALKAQKEAQKQMEALTAQAQAQSKAPMSIGAPMTAESNPLLTMQQGFVEQGGAAQPNNKVEHSLAQGVGAEMLRINAAKVAAENERMKGELQ